MTSFLILAMLCAMSLFASPLTAGAQDYPPPSGMSSKHEQIQSLINMRVATALSLDPQKSQQLSAIMRKYHERKRSLHQQMRALTQELRVQSASGNAAAIQATIQKLDQTKSELDRIDDQMFAEAKKILTPQQQAQFLLILDDIRREVRAIKQRPYGPGGYNQGLNPPPQPPSESNGVWVR